MLHIGPDVDGEAKRKALTAIMEAVFPPEDSLKIIYTQWMLRDYWTAKECAALIMGANPALLVENCDSLSQQQREQFDFFVDVIRRKFPTEVNPTQLRQFARTAPMENGLLWSTVDHFRPAEKKPPRKSDETRKQKTKDKMLYGLLLAANLISGPNATSKLKTRLAQVGIDLDEETLTRHVRELSQTLNVLESH